MLVFKYFNAQSTGTVISGRHTRGWFTENNGLIFVITYVSGIATGVIEPKSVQ